MVLLLDEGETLEDGVRRLQRALGGDGSNPETWLAKHAPSMAFMPRPCKSVEEWLKLYAQKAGICDLNPPLRDSNCRPLGTR
jgi:hypothetical protein